jgi:hypothetical protein
VVANNLGLYSSTAPAQAAVAAYQPPAAAHDFRMQTAIAVIPNLLGHRTRAVASNETVAAIDADMPNVPPKSHRR